MKFRKLLINLFFAVLFISAPFLAQDNPKWELDIDEPIEFYEFINEEKYLFITSGEYAWCYNSETGEKVWSLEIDGFEEEGISLLIGELYLTNSDNKLQAYDAVSGNLLWENEYDGISQEDYMDVFFVMNYAMFHFDDHKIGVDLNTGKELYRNEFIFWSDLVDLGTYNYDVIAKQEKLLVLEDSEIVSLYNIRTGEKVYSGEDYDINEDLIENDFNWSYNNNDETAYLFVLDDKVVLLDLVNNKVAAEKEFDIDGDKNVILPTAKGAAVMGEEKLVHFNFSTFEVVEVSFPFDDVRTLSAAKAGGKDILILGLGDEMAAIDLIEGKLLWQSAKDDPQFEGYAHRYIQMDDDNILLTYNRPRIMSSDNGTYVYLMSINAITGNVNYKTPVLLSEVVLSDFTRGLSKAVTGLFSAAMTVASGGVAAGSALNAYDQVNAAMGYSNIGFTYNYFEYDDDIIIQSRVKEAMMNPETRDEPGEGFVRVDKKTGEIVYASYFQLCEGFNEINHLAPVSFYHNLAFVAGDEKLVGFNLDDGKVLWTLGEEAGFVTDIKLIDNILYVKFGKQDFTVTLKEDDVEVKETFDEDPYGFMAIDALSGNILWKVNTEVDPSLQTPQFSLDNYYEESTNRLYFADDQNVYALKLGKDGGKYDWQFNFENNSLGELEYEETFAIQERWIGSVPRTTSSTTYLGGGWTMTTTRTSGGLNTDRANKFLEEASDADLTSTYTSWGNIYGVSAKKCLKVMYGDGLILVIAPEGFALLNTKDGNQIWKSEWDFSDDEVSYIPKVIGNSIVYCLDEDLVSLNLSDGTKRWNAEEDEEAKYFLSPNERYIYTINNETIKAYSVE